MKRMVLFIVVSLCVLLNSSVYADIGATPSDPNVIARLNELANQIADLQRLVADQQKTIKEQAQEINELQSTRAEKPVPVAVAPGAEIPEVPGWLEGLKWGGDLRLRYEAIDFSAGETVKAVRDRNRFRFRLRSGFEKQMFDDFKVGFRLASGDDAAPTSTNSSFDASFDKKSIFIDLVYATYQPDFPYLEGLEITGGKFKNPFVTSDILWDSDVNPEGLYERYQLSLMNGDLKPFVILAQLIIQEDSVGAPGDGELYVYQGGFDWKAVGNFMNDEPLKLKFAMSLYNFSEYDKVFTEASGNPTLPNGNLAVDDFDIFDFYVETGSVPFVVGGKKIPLKLFVHYLNNLDAGSPVTSTTNENQSYAYNYGFQMGDLERQGDMRLKLRYSYVGPLSVAGYLADADFGMNRRGIEAILTYRLRDHLDFEFTGNITGNITGADIEQRMFHSDLKMKF